MALPNLRAYVGQEIAFWRKERGFTQTELADAVGNAVKTLQGIEQGQRTPTDDLCRRIDAALGLNGVIARAGKQARADLTPWGSFREFEQRATTIRQYSNHVVPGMLQTPTYAREVIAALSPGADVDAEVADRMARQERLDGDEPPHLHVIIAASVLDQAIGGRAAWKEQLKRLLDPGPTVTVRILPASDRAHPGLGGPLDIVDLPEGDRIAFADGQAPGGLMDQPEHLARCDQTWEWISAHALPVDLTAEWIEALLKEIE